MLALTNKPVRLTRMMSADRDVVPRKTASRKTSMSLRAKKWGPVKMKM